MSSNDLHNAIDNIDILYDVKDDDHVPLVLHLNVDNIPKVSSENNDVTPKINWHNVNTKKLNKYYNSTCEALARLEIPVSALR